MPLALCPASAADCLSSVVVLTQPHAVAACFGANGHARSEQVWRFLGKNIVDVNIVGRDPWATTMYNTPCSLQQSQ